MVGGCVGVRQAKRRADQLFSLFVRKKHSRGGQARCVSCGKVLPIKELDAGHYVSRNHLSTRYDERNVHPQCQKCNRFDGGAMAGYTLYMLDTYGRETIEELHRLSKEVWRWKESDYRDLCKELNQKLKGMK